jgi:hypothetical protein
VATNTTPTAWLAEPDEMLATVLDIFAQRAAAIEAARHRKR